MTALLRLSLRVGAGLLIASLSTAAPGFPLVPSHHSLLDELEGIRGRLDSGDGSPRGALFLERASVERRLGRLDAAGRSLRCAAMWNRGSLAFAQEKCRYLTASGRFARAAEFLDPWLKPPSKDALSLMLRAEAHFGARAYQAAALDLELAREVGFRQFTIDAELRLSDAWSGADEPKKALVVLDRAIRDRGPLPALIEAAVELEVAGRRFGAALEWHSKVKLRSGTTPAWHAAHGDLLALAGRAEAARAAWGRAREVHADLPARRRCTAAATRLLEQIERKLAPTNEEGPQ